MTQKRVVSQIVLLIFMVFLLGCGSVMKMTGKIAARLMTQKTADLSNGAVTVMFIRNMYPPETKTVDFDYIDPSTWHDGANLVAIYTMKRKGIGMYSIDGKVTIDGEEATYFGNGAYGKWLDDDDLSPKTIRIETTAGKVYEFTVEPVPPIELVSVNGKKEDIEVDLRKPLSLEMRSPETTPNTEFSVALISNVMGVRTFLENGVFRYQDKITIPAVMWRNPMTPIAPVQGQNYLKVERFKINPRVVPGVGATQVVGVSYDWVPVTVTGKLEKTFVGTLDDQGLKFKKTIETPQGKIKVELTKPNAFWGRPLNSGKKFAVVSFVVRATKLRQTKTKQKTSEFYAGNYKITQTTTTTTTRTFPKLPDAYWENLVNSLYQDFEQRLTDVFNDITLVPIEKVLSAPSYKDLYPIKNQVSIVEVEKSYRGTKSLIPTNLSDMLKDISSTYASDRIDARLIRELGVDGIIAVTLDLEMPWEKFTLTPRMSIRIYGPPNGYKAGPTIYVQGTISGEGVPLEQAKMDADYMMDILPKVIRKKDLMNALEEGLIELSKREKQADYEKLWSLK